MPNLSIESWAEVRANDRVMRYRRTGVGPAVILLRSSDHPHPLWPELLEALGAGFRLIIPEPPAGDADVGGWLADFLEGLGMSNMRIVAADRFCIPALELRLLGVDQVARIVLVPEETLETAVRQSMVSLLVVQRSDPRDEILPLVTSFLA